MDAKQIKPHCPYCNTKGNTLFSNLRDHIFNTPGSWDYSFCKSCNIIWNSNRPLESDIHKYYSNYYTSTVSFTSTRKRLLERLKIYLFIMYHSKEKSLGRYLTGLISSAKIIDLAYMGSFKCENISVLDIGCGNGDYLRLLSKLNIEAIGYEPDKNSRKTASKNSGCIVTSDLNQLTISSFDLITLNNVVEHVYNLPLLLESCIKLLKPNGKLVIRTPNIESLGSHFFRNDWRGLEPPRHIILYSLASLTEILKSQGFTPIKRYTHSKSAKYIYQQSSLIRKRRKNQRRTNRFIVIFSSYLFHTYANVRNYFIPTSGEEIYMVVRYG